MQDLILFSQQQPYRVFAERAELMKHRKGSHSQPPHINIKNLELPLKGTHSQELDLHLRKFHADFRQLLLNQPQISTQLLLQEFRKETSLQELAELLEERLGQENLKLHDELIAQKQQFHKLKEDLQQQIRRESSQAGMSSTSTTRNNFNAITPDGNIELSRTLYQKARSGTLGEFHELVNSFFLNDKVKVTGVKQWPRLHAEDGVGTARNVIQEAIEEVRTTLSKAQPQYSTQYIANMLQDHFVGRREKFELVSKMLTNETILRHLEDMFEQGGIPCPQPCCMLRSKNKHSVSVALTSKPSSRYIQQGKRSSEICYKSDQVTNYMERFRVSMRERNGRQEDIRSISKTNLEQVESFERFFNQQQSRRKKLEYRERQKMDNTLRDFIKSFK